MEFRIKLGRNIKEIRQKEELKCIDLEKDLKIWLKWVKRES